ncbi:hypothetical protein OEA41_006421 [Lepraria neglecta]|uniref:Uncharacterized protein n=1 Tax=Lepraria neglecta TaxID=209136 RepID=A0AAD9ZB57_9LECA|nr:hypothetical protein OEA41_006421 [Lepraria neglecta]
MFDFTKLPREIRDKMYECKLVRGTIKLVTIPPLARDGSKNAQDSYSNRLTSPKILRSTRIMRLLDGTEFLASYCKDDTIMDINLTVLSVNRQMYDEAWTIFYGQNAFDFTTPTTMSNYDSVWNCMAFLRDRPSYTLPHIKELHLLMGDDSLQLLLRGLSLLGWRLLYFITPERFLPDYVDADGSKFYWYDYLSKINGLRKLVVEVTSICDTEKTVSLQKLRAQMLKGGEETGTADISAKEELLHVDARTFFLVALEL